MANIDNGAFSRFEEAMRQAEEVLDLDTENMSLSEAEKALERLEEIYDILADHEVEDEESDETLAWEELLEDMDDMLDDLRDRLDTAHA